MTRPRIALDFTNLDALSLANGQYRYVVDLVQGLARLRPEMDFLLLGSRDEPVPELRAVFAERGGRWDYRRVQRWNHRGSYYADHARYAVLLRRERVSLLHVLHTFVPLFAPCRIVVTIYDLMYELFDDYREARLSRPYRIHRWAVKRLAERAICISETTAADLRRLWGIDGGRTDTVPLGTSFPKGLSPTDDTVRRMRSHTDSSLTLLSPYNLEPRKNLDVLLKVLARLRERGKRLKLILFGRAAVTPEREEQFERAIRELNIGEDVIRVGMLTDEELTALYSRASLFVFPSLYEGFGLPILEAMSAGACVVARNASAMAEVVGDAGALVETNDPLRLAEAVAQLLDDDERRRTLGRRARDRAALFSMERMAQLTCQSYHAALVGKLCATTSSPLLSGAVRRDAKP